MIGIEKDGIIIKSQKGLQTYGIAGELNIHIPMLTMIEATVVNMVVVQIQKATQEPTATASTSSK